jgi:hypothetical protein
MSIHLECLLLLIWCCGRVEPFGMWATQNSLPTARAQHGSAMYVTGGSTPGSVPGVAALPLARMVVLGGYSGPTSTYLSSVETYRVLTDSWLSKNAMPTARRGPSVSGSEKNDATGYYIYSIGGVGSPGLLPTNERYDEVADVWNSRNSMPTAVDMAAAGVDMTASPWVVFFGGIDVPGSQSPTSSNRAQRYQMDTDQWQYRNSMPTNRHSLRSAQKNDNFWLFGGSIVPSGASTTINELYNHGTDTWVTRNALPTVSPIAPHTHGQHACRSSNRSGNISHRCRNNRSGYISHRCKNRSGYISHRCLNNRSGNISQRCSNSGS